MNDIPARISVFLQHVRDDGAGFLDLVDGEGAVVVLVLRIDDEESGVLGAGGGGGDADERAKGAAWLGLHNVLFGGDWWVGMRSGRKVIKGYGLRLGPVD